MKRPMVIIAGPTAAGKTELSIELAKRIGGSVISADSMQVYRGMDIGSAKISVDRMQGIRHYLIDELMPNDSFHIYRFQQMANKALDEIYSEQKIPIVAGGTGFYIQALLYQIDFTNESASQQFRKEMEELADREGNHALHERLKEIDPVSYDAIHENNRKRVIRALEFYHTNGMPISQHNMQERMRQSPFDFVYFVLTDERQYLYGKIDRRVDKMMEDGLLEEVKRLTAMGCTRDMVSMQGLGYKQLLSYLDGECTLEEAVTAIKRETRHFAKRQLTWFRRERESIWIDKSQYNRDEDLILSEILRQIRLKLGLPYRWESQRRNDIEEQ